MMLRHAKCHGVEHALAHETSRWLLVNARIHTTPHSQWRTAQPVHCVQPQQLDAASRDPGGQAEVRLRVVGVEQVVSVSQPITLCSPTEHLPPASGLMGPHTEPGAHSVHMYMRLLHEAQE